MLYLFRNERIMLTIIKDIDLIDHVKEYDVILVGTNTYHTMGNGFQRKIRLRYPKTYKANLETKYGDINKLGKNLKIILPNKPTFILCFITYGYNFRPDLNPDYLRYEALEKCISYVNTEFSGSTVATTMIGCSKFDGNGDKKKVIDILEKNSNNINLYVYDYTQLKSNVETAIRYNNIVKNNNYDREKKTELINEMIQESKNLPMMDNVNKRLNSIKEDVEALLNN